MEKTKVIKCDKCGISVTCKTKRLQGTQIKCWDIPKGWNVTLPHGWLCPKCKV